MTSQGLNKLSKITRISVKHKAQYLNCLGVTARYRCEGCFNTAFILLVVIMLTGLSFIVALNYKILYYIFVIII
jgi:hypothetical protein